jgi:hypothetical protein
VITTLIDGMAGITAGCLIPAIGFLIIRGIRSSARFAVATWRMNEPDQQESIQRQPETAGSRT